MKILWKRKVFTEFPAIRAIIRSSAETAFLQNFHTRKVGQITVFQVVFISSESSIKYNYQFTGIVLITQIVKKILCENEDVTSFFNGSRAYK